MKVTCKLVGGLGNQMFTIAATIAYSIKYNIDYCIPSKVENKHLPDQSPYIFSGVRYCDNVKGIQCYYNEPFFHYQEIPKMDCENHVLNGYFQSIKYFQDYLPEIRNVFGFNYKTKKGVVGVHVRRGDYLNLPNHHPVVTMEYIGKAIYLMHTKGYNNFLVHSDDLEWCKEYLLQSSLNFIVDFEFSENKNDMQDFESLTNCEHQIISNSSFGLMAAMLNINPNKVCIAPSKWFGKELPHDTKDLIPENYIIL